MIRFSAIAILSIGFFSCTNNQHNPNQDTANLSDKDTISESSKGEIHKFALVEPIKNIIYYMNEVDITTYDSIATQYFHEVLDYTDTAAIALEYEIQHLQTTIDSDTVPLFEKETAEVELSKLSKELNKYEKSITGYVFVHTFLNKGDTLCAIIITNADMTKGEAIPVNNPGEIEPSAFANNIRKIEQ